MSAKSSNARLSRLLKLIPFLQKNAGASVEKTAQLFGISEKELISDLNLIWLCGLPGYSHLELIDVSYDSGFISIANAETLERPMRISFQEGAALLLAITKLSEVTPHADSGTLISLRNKIASLLSLDLPRDSEMPLEDQGSLILPEIQSVIESSDALLDIEYFSATLNENLLLRIKPMEIQSRNGFLYLIGYSLSDHRHRFFRIDRVLKVQSVDGEVTGGSGDIYGSESAIVSVEVDESGAWFMQKWRLDSLKRDPHRKVFSGSVTVYDPRWLERAVLASGGTMRVLTPDSHRAQVALAATRALQKYR
ncbi:MAG: WYL domain-containing protein [Actinomycetota bacterium]